MNICRIGLRENQKMIFDKTTDKKKIYYIK